MKLYSKGFTLIEMVVVAPVVILAIGAFIATIVNMTGEVMSSRGSNAITFEIQDSLNRIEQDIKLSTGFMAQSSISFTSSNPQGLGSDGTSSFQNVGGPSGNVLILGALATNGNPLSQGVGNIYINDAPNSCASGDYLSNTPLHINIVYFVDDDGVLWRRTIMPTNYASGSLCGGTVWQQPSCTPGWSHNFCKTDDIKLLEGVSAEDFLVDYYTTASGSTPISTATDPTASFQARRAAVHSAQTASISISSNKKIAGRDVSRTGSVRVTRLDTNATAVAEVVVPSLTGKSPVVSATVVEGNDVKFDWQQLAGADSYTAQYRISANGGSTWGSWTNAMNGGSTSFPNTKRTYTLVLAHHGDTVEFRVRGVNSLGVSSYGTESILIPVWATLPMREGWTTYNTSYSPPGYTKTRTGMVMLRGMIKGGATTHDLTIANLPEKYRPTGRLIMGTTTYGSIHTRADVLPNGDVRVLNATTSSTWYSLDTIRYMPDGMYTRVNGVLNTSAGFQNYGTSYAPASYVQDSVGRVHVQGLIKGGSLTTGTQIMSIPANLRPSQFILFSGGATNFHHFGINTTAGIEARGTGSTGHMTLNINYLPSSHTSWSNLPLSNGWTTYGSSFTTPQYSKTSDNVVNVKGLIRNGTATAGTIMATLPPNCRPQYRVMYATVGANAPARIEVTAAGSIVFTNGSSSWMSLDNLTFVASSSDPC